MKTRDHSNTSHGATAPWLKLLVLPLLLAVSEEGLTAHAQAPALPAGSTPSATEKPVYAGERTSAMHINVLGAVNRPGRYALPAGATLLDALASAGGASRIADTRQVRLLRGKAGETPGLIKIDLDRVLAGEERAPVLQAGDTVFFSEHFF